MSYDSKVMASLPQFVQLQFPVQLTTKGAIELSVLDSCKRDPVNGRSFADIQAGLAELQSLRRARQQYIYLDYMQARKAQQQRKGAPLAFLSAEAKAIPTFSPPPVPTPSSSYLIDCFAAWCDSAKHHITAHLAAVGGHIWKIDHTFLDAKYVAPPPTSLLGFLLSLCSADAPFLHCKSPPHF